MRRLKGYLRKVSDGLAPPAGSVVVHARPRVDGAEINETTHALGDLIVDHQAGSGSATLADGAGAFGWEMELSPGLIDVSVEPSDPQDEVHLRFPDESSQVGMAFHSDIQRLGWAAGGDGLIWNAIPGGDDPSAASWSTDAHNTWNLGNGSIASFGAGVVTLRPFIAFVGGVLFSIERANVLCPIGAGAAPANASGSERWDLLELVLNTDVASAEYGRQSIRITVGTPGGGIPVPTAPTATQRRCPIHALLMPTGGGVYTAAYDLRQWRGESRRVVAPPIFKTWAQPGRDRWRNVRQELVYGQSEISSILNTALSSDELSVPPAVSYQGLIVWNAHLRPLDGPENDMNTLFVKVTSEAYDNAGALVPGTNYVLSPQTEGTPVALIQHNQHLQSTNLVCPISMIPSFDIFSQVSAESRSWSRLRFKVLLTFNEPPASSDSKVRVFRQSLTASLWPVT